MTEIFRAGIQSVGHGQTEAADALGMSYGAADAARRVAPSRSGHHPADGQRVHRDDEGHRARLRRSSARALPPSGPGRADGLPRPRSAHRRGGRLLDPHGHPDVLPGRLERKMGRGYVRTGEGGTKPTARKRSYLRRHRRGAAHDGHPRGTRRRAGRRCRRSDLLKEEDGSTRSYGIDGTTSPEDGDERP